MSTVRCHLKETKSLNRQLKNACDDSYHIALIENLPVVLYVAKEAEKKAGHHAYV